MTLGGVISNLGATLNGGYTSNITITDATNDIHIPSINNGLNNLYVDRSSASTYMDGDLKISGTITLNSGSFNISSYTLDMKGGITKNSGNFTGGSTSNITVDSTNSALK